MAREKAFKLLNNELDGDVLHDRLHQMMYATDASVYRKYPDAIVFPKNEEDLIRIVHFARNEGLPLIPRTAGTSLAGQVVGEGIICDTSRYMTGILDIDRKNKTVTVQPGVIRDVLNLQLKGSGLFFGPNTSTSNRCMIGGMIGNNSSGTTSIKYGCTRDKLRAMSLVLADGQTLEINDEKAILHSASTLFSNVLLQVHHLSKESSIEKIRSAFPNPDIHRRNTGYALDLLVDAIQLENNLPKALLNVLCGSEGTLALTSEATLQLDDLPPPVYGMVCLEYRTLHEALEDVVEIMKYEPYQCELMDEVIINCTKGHPKYERYLRLLKGNPKAVLMVELRGHTEVELKKEVYSFKSGVSDFRRCESIQWLEAEEADQLWQLRKAGLGLLANMPGDRKAVACIEDTAVSLPDLPSYIDEFEALMNSFDQEAVYYAHAGAGELHLRPILDLKKSEDVKLFEAISQGSAQLVKKYNGSLSGEHGDGRVRAGFIKDMVGEEVYNLMRQMKHAWDPDNLFNPGKIIDAPPMTSDLRYEPDLEHRAISTTLDFNSEGGILRAAEKCNGSGDCRSAGLQGGTMCPSYRATLDEKDSTRARANVFREVLTNNSRSNPFDSSELKEVLDLCLSCKGCLKECPSGVDISSMKAEFQHQYYKHHMRPLRDWLFAYSNDLYSKLGWIGRQGANLMSGSFGRIVLSAFGISPKRTLPTPVKATRSQLDPEFHWDPERLATVDLVLLNDEFAQVYNSDLLLLSAKVLNALGFRTMISPPLDTGRPMISKGFLKTVKTKISNQIALIDLLNSTDAALVGIEPSAVLGIKDEWVRLAPRHAIRSIKKLSQKTYTIEEYLWDGYQKGLWTADKFSFQKQRIHVHAHCHFKALAKEDDIYFLLDILPGSEVIRIPSGCCGMAGSFGYEKEHYQISRTIGEEVLFPHLRQIEENDLVATNGFSCQHQIHDFLGIRSHHPIEIMHRRLQ